MRKLFAFLASLALVGAGLFVSSAAAQAESTEECTLVQSYPYNGANLFIWSRGLEGCSGNVYWEIRTSDWFYGEYDIIYDSGTTHYNNEVVSYWGHDDPDFPCFVELYAKYGDQEITRPPAHYNNCSPS